MVEAASRSTAGRGLEHMLPYVRTALKFLFFRHTLQSFRGHGLPTAKTFEVVADMAHVVLSVPLERGWKLIQH